MNGWLQHIAVLHPIEAYSLFFAVVFIESAFFPAAPFLPGDGLLFAVGVLAASGGINLGIAMFVLVLGGVLGNLIAYLLGKKLGPPIFEKFRFLNRKDYLRAHEFYKDYGNKAFILSRFIPMIRSLVPLIAGIAQLNQRDFTKYNILSVCLWVITIVLTAYFLGHIPIIQQHFTWIIIAMAGLGLIPLIIVGIRSVIKGSKWHLRS